MTFSDFSDITKKTPERKLTKPLKKSGGRNNLGRITMRRRGGGHKRKYRIIDFKRNKYGIPASVIAIEYDPNRTSRIALLEYNDKDRRYIIATSGMKVGDKLISSRNGPRKSKVVSVSFNEITTCPFSVNFCIARSTDSARISPSLRLPSLFLVRN